MIIVHIVVGSPRRSPFKSRRPCPAKLPGIVAFDLAVPGRIETRRINAVESTATGD